MDGLICAQMNLNRREMLGFLEIFEWWTIDDSELDQIELQEYYETEIQAVFGG